MSNKRLQMQKRRTRTETRYALRPPKELRSAFTSMAQEKHGVGPGEFTNAMLTRYWPAIEYDSWNDATAAGCELLPAWLMGLITMIEGDAQWPTSSAAHANETALAALERIGKAVFAGIQQGGQKQ